MFALVMGAVLVLTVRPDVAPRAAEVLANAGTRSLEAYDAYLESRTLLNRLGPGDTARATARLERAVALDPTFARGWAALAGAYASAHEMLEAPTAERPDAAATRARTQVAAMRAVDLAPDTDFVLVAMGKIDIQNRDWDGAERHLRRALEMHGGADYEANMTYGALLTNVGRARAAVRYFRRAAELEPLLRRPSIMLASAYTLVGDGERADAELLRGRSLLGDRYISRGNELLRAMTRRDTAAIDALLLEDTTPFGVSMRRTLRDSAAALEELHRRLEDAALRSDPFQMRITAHWAAFHRDYPLAVRALREAMRSGLNIFYIWRPDLAPLRELAEFREMVSDLGLASYWRATGEWGDYCSPATGTEFDCGVRR